MISAKERLKFDEHANVVGIELKDEYGQWQWQDVHYINDCKVNYEWLWCLIATAEEYDPGHSQWTATTLVSGPRRRFMQKKYGEQTPTSLKALHSVLLGTSYHTQIESMMRYLDPEASLEIRVYREITLPDGSVELVSMKYDILKHIAHEYYLHDSKTCVTTYINKDPADGYKKQLNIGRWVLEGPHFSFDKDGNRVDHKPIKIKAMMLDYMAKDWKAIQSVVRDNYPDPFRNVEVARMPDDQVEAFICERIQLHKEANESTFCLREERFGNGMTMKAYPYGARGFTLASPVKKAETVFEHPGHQNWASAEVERKLQNIAKDGKLPGQRFELRVYRDDYKSCQAYCTYHNQCTQYKKGTQAYATQAFYSAGDIHLN